MTPARRRDFSPEDDRRLSGDFTQIAPFSHASPRSTGALSVDSESQWTTPARRWDSLGMTRPRRRGLPRHFRAAPPARCILRGSLSVWRQKRLPSSLAPPASHRFLTARFPVSFLPLLTCLRHLHGVSVTSSCVPSNRSHDAMMILMCWLAPVSSPPPPATSCPRCPVPRPCSGAVPMRRGA